MYTRVNHPERPCRVCATLFKPNRADRRLCSEDCKKVEVRDRARTWYYANHDDNKIVNRQRSMKFRVSLPEHHMLNAAKDRAKIKGLDFDITIEDIVIPELCPILRVPLARKTPYAPSLDRKDPVKGYIKGNVWVISRKANTMKNDATTKEIKAFGNWARTFQV